VVHAPSLSLFKRHLDNGLNNVLSLLVRPEVARQLDEMIIDEAPCRNDLEMLDMHQSMTPHGMPVKVLQDVASIIVATL